jgi:hypothetical protein
MRAVGRLRRFWIAVLVLIVWCAGARAQPEPITLEEIAEYADMLALTPEQREIVDALHDGYAAETKRIMADVSDRFRAGYESLKEVDESERDEKELEIALGMGPIWLDAYRTFTGVEARFLGDVRSVLEDAQLAEWPRVERLRRKHAFLDQVEVAGAELDLTGVLEEPAPPGLDQVRLEYELKLDALMSRRAAHTEAIAELVATGATVRESLDMLTPEEQRRVDELNVSAIRIDLDLLDLNERYTDLFAATLAPEQAAAFRGNVEMAWYGRYVNSDNILVKIYQRVLALDSLSDEQRASITSLRDRYTEEVLAVERRRSRAEVEHLVFNKRFEIGDVKPELVDESHARLKEATNATATVIERGLARLRTPLTSTQIRDAGLTDLFESKSFTEWSRRLHAIERGERRQAAESGGPT